MKTLSTFLRQSSQILIVLVSLVYFPCLALALEPIGTIGQPLPEQHVFLFNENLCASCQHTFRLLPHTQMKLSTNSANAYMNKHTSATLLSAQRLNIWQS